MGAVFFVLHVIRSKGAQMSEKDLSKLSRMIEDALVIAVEMDETTAIYLLSMASIEVTEKMATQDPMLPRGDPRQPMR
jgi:hypothetical protein